MGFWKQLLNNNRHTPASPANANDLPAQAVSSCLPCNTTYIRKAFFDTDDLKIREVMLGPRKGLLLYLESLCDDKTISEKIIKPLVETEKPITEEVLITISQYRYDELTRVVDSIAKGYVALFGEGMAECCLINAKANNERAVNEPENEKVVRGPHKGFIENLDVNLQMVRKLIANRHLVIRYYELGSETKSRTAMVYLQHLANPSLVQEADRRIRSISVDSVAYLGMIEENLEGRSYSPFPQLLTTERPGRVVNNLLEGRVALFLEGHPAANLFPATFIAFYQSPDDYGSRSLTGTFIRMIRLFSFFIAIVLPAFYIAVISFHFEVIPTDLFLTLKSGVERIPFSPILEALIMELTIELLSEASIRLPGRVGQTIGIVGGLVIGDAVVKAGLVSNAMIVVVALTALASFVVPSYEMSSALRVLRFPVMISAALFGFLGIVVSVTAIVIHLCKLESFGTPYFAPLAPFRLKDFKDALVRLPAWKLNERPLDAHPQKLRQEYPSREWERDDDK